MRIDILTILPSMFSGPMDASMIGIAREKGLLELHIHDLRDYTHDVHRTTDDSPYGGGPGMVMKPEPVFEALDAIRAMDPEPAVVIALTPAAPTFDQRRAAHLSRLPRLILICGRYEGIDERVLETVDMRLSIGDYVLTGGELPAMVVVDAVTRLLPGVLGHESSVDDESFSAGLLEYPQYTRPAVYRDREVPDILRSGDHARIAAFRREQAILTTARMRPDLLDTADLTDAERELASRAVDDDIPEGHR